MWNSFTSQRILLCTKISLDEIWILQLLYVVFNKTTWLFTTYTRPQRISQTFPIQICLGILNLNYTFIGTCKATRVMFMILYGRAKLTCCFASTDIDHVLSNCIYVLLSASLGQQWGTLNQLIDVGCQWPQTLPQTDDLMSSVKYWRTIFVSYFLQHS